MAAGLVALVAIMPFSCIVFAAEDDAKHLPEVSFGSSLPNELADPLGARSALSRYGIVQTAIYTGEVFENISGGFAEGGHYHGLVDVATDIDMGTFIGWQGMSFHTNMYVTHGSSITADNVGTIAAVSHIEATPSIRLFEAWLDQSLLGGAASIRFGQLAIDAEFATLDTGGAFISSTFGWNTLMTDNLPNGGPIYPLAAPGVRVKVQPTAGLLLQAAIFNGDPVGDCEGDPQKCNDHGLEFRLKDPPLVMAELAYTHSLSLPGAIKIGSWISFDDFKDQRLSDDGRGGHVPHPDDTDNARLLESTAILGLRTKVVY